VNDAKDVRHLCARHGLGASHLRRRLRAPEEDADLEKTAFRANEEVAGAAGEHDGPPRRVDPLPAKGSSGLAKTLPRLPEIVAQVFGEGGFRGRPAIVRFAGLDPLLAVMTLAPGHVPNLINLSGVGLALDVIPPVTSPAAG
jgi:hypothetical protein